MSKKTTEPLDHFEIVQQSSINRAIAHLRAAFCGFTESKQHYYEGLLFPLEVGFGVSGERLERRIRQATMLEAFNVSDDVFEVFARIAATGRLDQQSVLLLQERLGVSRDQWVGLCTASHRACMRTAQNGDPR